MSTTSASCCCDDKKLADTIFYVKGSGSGGKFSVNNPSLNFYLAEAEKGITCEDCKYHGGISITPPWSYTVMVGGVPQLRSEIGDFILPYGGTDHSNTLKHFPNVASLDIDVQKRKFSTENYTKDALTRVHLSNKIIKLKEKNPRFNQFIKAVKDLGTIDFVGEEETTPFKICDCFTEKLYTREEKTEEENFRATIQQFLCSWWRVGVNANAITWKPSIFHGIHDPTIKANYPTDNNSIPRDDVGPGEWFESRLLESGTFDGIPGPSQRQHAVTVFLPNSRSQFNISEPMMFNMPNITGKNRTDGFNEDPTRPQPEYENWLYFIQGNPQDTPKTIRYKNIRLLMAVLRYAYGGFQNLFGRIGGEPYRLYDEEYVWTDPDRIAWGVFYDFADRILSPDPATFTAYTKLVKKAVKNGDFRSASPGCQASKSTIEMCSGAPGAGTVSPCSGGTPEGGVPYTSEPAVFQDVFMNGTNDVVGQRANVEYARSPDDILIGSAKTDPSRRKSLVYFTVNEFERTCLTKTSTFNGSGSSSSCGPSQRRNCCVFSSVDVWNSSTDTTITCPNSFFAYYIDFPFYSITYLPEWKKGILGFGFDAGARPFSKTFNLQLLISKPGPGRCGFLSTGLGYVQKSTIPKAWWCTEDGEEIANLHIDPYDKTVFYNLLPAIENYSGGAGVEVPVTNGTAFSQTAIDTSTPEYQCLPGGGIGCVQTITRTVEYPACPDYFDGSETETSTASILHGAFGCKCVDPAQYNYEEGPDIEMDSFSPCIESITTVKSEGSAVTYCSTLSQEERDREFCCGQTPPSNSCNGIPINTGSNTRATTCSSVPNSHFNPFINFSQNHQNYGEFLTAISRRKFKKFKGVGPVALSAWGEPEPGNAIQDPIQPPKLIDLDYWSSSSYKQSLITNLYGISLERGDISLKEWSVVFERDGEEFEVLPNVNEQLNTGLKRLNWSVTNSFGGDNTGQASPGSATVNVKPEWPQAFPAPRIRTTSGIISMSLDPSTYRQEFIEQLKERTTLEASQWSSRQFSGRVGDIVKLYWEWRMIRELADVFVLNYGGITGPDGEEIKTGYYPDGLPNLEYTNKKLKIKGNGVVQIVTTEKPYKLNWFAAPLDEIVIFDFEN